MWCEQHGLKPEAAAHLTVVTQLDPGREAAWKRLGYKKQGSRWITDQQLAEWKAEVKARTKADKYWTTRARQIAERAGRRVTAGRGGRGASGRYRAGCRPVGLGDLRQWRHAAPEARRAASRADRFAGLDASAGDPGRRESNPAKYAASPSRRCAAAIRGKSRPSWLAFCATSSSIVIRSSTTISCNRSVGTRSARWVTCSSAARSTMFSGPTPSMNR